MLCNVGLLFDRWRTSFYVMAVIIMEWLHKAWNGAYKQESQVKPVNQLYTLKQCCVTIVLYDMDTV